MIQVHWWDPGSKYLVGRSVGTWRVDECTYRPGIFRLHGARGAEHFELTEPIKVPRLRQGRKTWMVDDPLHAWTIADHAHDLRKCRHVLVIGLGLGIISRALTREGVDHMVIERAPEVVRIFGMSKPKRLVIENAWWWLQEHRREAEEFDGVFCDTLVGDCDKLFADAMRQVVELAELLPNATECRILGYPAKLTNDTFAAIRRSRELALCLNLQSSTRSCHAAAERPF